MERSKMQVFHHPSCLVHDPPHEILSGQPVPYKESPDRLVLVRDALAADSAQYDLKQVPDFDAMKYVSLVHSSEYIDYLETAYERWVSEGGDAAGVLPECFPHPKLPPRLLDPNQMSAIARAGFYCFDLSSPITADTYTAVLASAKVAIHSAKELATLAQTATDAPRPPGIFAITRPPGHHAAAELSGGYCYLNNVAIAARTLQHIHPRSGPGSAKIAILDIDYHHGNGTQSIFYDDPSVLYVSLHAQGDYPYFTGSAAETGVGEGLGKNVNIPLPMNGTGDEEYLVALDGGVEVVKSFEPDYILVSLGVDTYQDDPICTFGLTTPVYERIGGRIAQLGLPTLFLFEGGYYLPALAANVKGVLDGFQRPL
ncbi:Arginase/deacetylase [Auriculariales sp. MPI-PUGE-AT-0066]|nr:Arginase/deacetylase [Auriculariales sp. MPI-PUGE-AT-0066]